MTTTDGFGRPTVLCAVHADGHVGAVATGYLSEQQVTSLCELLTRAGVPGWTLRRLVLEEAVRAHAAGMSCPECAIVLPCGCSIARILQRQCPHGSGQKIHKIAHETGYCSNDHPQHEGPPL